MSSGSEYFPDEESTDSDSSIEKEIYNSTKNKTIDEKVQEFKEIISQQKIKEKPDQNISIPVSGSTFKSSGSENDAIDSDSPLEKETCQDSKGNKTIDEKVQEFKEIVNEKKLKEKSDQNITIQISKSTPEKRHYDKMFACFYCSKIVLKMSSYLLSIHGDEKDVKKIKMLDVGCEDRKILLEKIRLKGNFIHNMKVLNEGRGTILVTRRTKKNEFQIKDYLPCIFVMGSF